MSLTTLLAVSAGLALAFALYRFFYRERDTGGTDQRNWVNESNYNIAAGDGQEGAIASATPAETANLVAHAKDAGSVPADDESFHAMRDKLGLESKSSEDVKRDLSA